MSPPHPIAVLGGGGHAKVVTATLRAAGHQKIEIFDDDPALWGLSLLGISIRGPIEQVRESGIRHAVMAIGDNHARRRSQQRVEGADLEWTTVVHPAAHVEPTARLGRGTVVFAGAVVQPDTTLGRHVILNTGATVDHDSSVADFAHIGPGAHLGGSVTVGEGTLIGIGAAVLPGKKIGSWAVVGGGGAVIKDIPSDATVRGVPARAARDGV